MAEPASFSSSIEKLRKAIKSKTDNAADRQLKNILRSLDAIALQLEAWAKPTQPIGNATKLPSKKIVSDVSDAINELVEIFEDMEKWLEKRNLDKQHWSTLLAIIPDLRSQYLSDEIRVLFGSYCRWLAEIPENTRPPSDEEFAYESNRLRMANNMRQLASAIEDTVFKVRNLS
ncbi:MAG: hypothetical protein AAGF93_02075 [Cyanobacteria bacterium P01_H01_bin.105]